MTDIDEATGLPTLPPKYRWRVTDVGGYNIWQVKIQRLVWGWLPFTVESMGSQRVPSRDEVRRLASLAIVAWERQRRMYEGNPYRGNYPPKRLDEA